MFEWINNAPETHLNSRKIRLLKAAIKQPETSFGNCTIFHDQICMLERKLVCKEKNRHENPLTIILYQAKTSVEPETQLNFNYVKTTRLFCKAFNNFLSLRFRIWEVKIFNCLIRIIPQSIFAHTHKCKLSFIRKYIFSNIHERMLNDSSTWKFCRRHGDVDFSIEKSWQSVK